MTGIGDSCIIHDETVPTILTTSGRVLAGSIINDRTTFENRDTARDHPRGKFFYGGDSS